MAPADSCLIPVKVLSVGSHADDHVALGKALGSAEPPAPLNCRFDLIAVRGADEALQLLENHRIPVVLCECELGEDTWRTLLARLEELQDPPFLIVASRMADEFLWAEALNLGAYDVLSKPFRASEVVRALALAWLRWSRTERPCRAMA